MEINEELIKHIASVARLDLTDDEVKQFTPELKEVLEAFLKLQQVDTKGIEPAFHPIDLPEQFREDTPHECLTQDEALSNAEHKKDGYFKGPKAIDK